MSKMIQLNDSSEDQKLIQRIQEYQKEKHLPSFVSAVRVLCNDALDLKKLLK